MRVYDLFEFFSWVLEHNNSILSYERAITQIPNIVVAKHNKSRRLMHGTFLMDNLRLFFLDQRVRESNFSLFVFLWVFNKPAKLDSLGLP